MHANKSFEWTANGLKVSNRTTQRPSPEYKSNWPWFRVHTVAFNLLAALKSTYITIPDKVISVAHFIMYFQFLLSLFQSSHIWTQEQEVPQVHKIIGQIYAFMNSYKCFTALRQLVQKKKCFKQCSTKVIFVFAGFQTKFLWYEWKMLKVLIWF